MKLLATLHRRPVPNLGGRTSYRQAVRAIILRGSALLMVYSPVNGDYKFPGGGVDRGEDHPSALRREVREECGAQLTKVGAGFGKVIEYDLPGLPGYEVFKMTSYYYLCEADDARQPQRLDVYEADLLFQPVWVEVDDALRVNRNILEAGRDSQGWTRRETLVLEAIRASFLPGHPLNLAPSP